MTEQERLARIANDLDALALPHERFAAEYGSKFSAVDAAAYRRAAAAVRSIVEPRATVADDRPPLEQIRQLLDRASELADELTNAEPDHRRASALSRISDGLDLARERVATCEEAAA